MLRRRISDAPLSFLFLGPSGVGKTEYARNVASMLHQAPIEELNDGRFVVLQLPPTEKKRKKKECVKGTGKCFFVVGTEQILFWQRATIESIQ